MDIHHLEVNRTTPNDSLSYLFFAFISNNDEERTMVVDDSIIYHRLDSLIDFFPDHHSVRNGERCELDRNAACEPKSCAREKTRATDLQRENIANLFD
jgi:hypothetical protein